MNEDGANTTDTAELDSDGLDAYLAQQSKPKRTRSDAGKPRGPRKPKQTVLAQSELHASVVMLIGALALFAQEEYRPLRYEIDMIFEPLERILLRRAIIADKFNPDVVDGLQSLIGMCIYASRIYHASASRQPIAHGLPSGLPQSNGNANAERSVAANQFANAENQLASLHRNLQPDSAT